MNAQPHLDRARLPIMALAMVALLAALWAGLVRIGWPFPPLIPGLVAVHGGLMISGFLGTVISMERAVALGRRWGYAAPLLMGIGSLLLLVEALTPVGIVLSAIGGIFFVAIFVVIVRRQTAIFTLTMALGVVCFFIGDLIWLAGFPVFRLVLWWTAFLILTIVGERLELSRLMRLSRASERLYLAAVGVLLLGLVTDAVEGLTLPAVGSTIGVRIAGLGMLGLALWLLRYDIARRTIRQSGLTRFIGWCLILGYIWLGLGGLLRLVTGGAPAGPLYDATLHTVFLGFVMSMIFGHAPIILPAVLGRAVPYKTDFYAHLVLLHLSLALRIAGDLLPSFEMREWGGLLNVLAVLLFLFVTARGVVLARRARPLAKTVSSAIIH
ncbi:MAG: hypothetical protein M1570_04000 [Chloroflexi bacterium]|nr:hypothetical protein [Chloroflexota bacterium]